MDPTESDGPLVLFADDEIALHGLIESLLTRHGYRVECHSNGADALESFRRNRHDALIIDLMMPRMNGYELLMELVGLDRDARRRVIVVSGASEETWQWFDQSSVAAFLVKPVDLNLLLEALRDCVARRPLP